MDLDAARDFFFTPTDESTEERPTPARRLRDAIEPLATIGYHADVALAAYAEVGFDFMRGYVWGRVSSMGEPDPMVAVSSYGVWQPDAIRRAYDSARASVSLWEMRRLRLRAATESVREVLGDPDGVDGLADTVEALEQAVSRASVLGRPIFAGLSGHPQPPDLLGRLWHVTNCVREHRGDAHLAALVGAGIDGVQANLLNELWHGFDQFEFTATREFTREQMDDGLARLERRGLLDGGELTEKGEALREVVEQLTDAAEQPLVDDIDGVETHVARIDGWSQQVIDHGWYPTEPGKRYAG